jgi:hypothetical protein
MLSVSISYCDLFKCLYFADTTKRGDRGGEKEAQRQGEDRVTSQITLIFGHFYCNSTMEAPLWTPQLQNRIKCITQQPTFPVYMHESSTLGKSYEIKLRCYWERLKEQFGNLGNLKGTQ